MANRGDLLVPNISGNQSTTCFKSSGWRTKERVTLRGHKHAVQSVAFSPDGTTLASGSLDHSLKLWNVVTGKERTTFQGHTSAVQSVAFSPDGKALVSGSNDETVKLWDIAAGKEKATFRGTRTGYLVWRSAPTEKPWLREVGEEK